MTENNTRFTDVGVDMDGVLYPFASAFKKYCEKILGYRDLPDPDIWDFYLSWGISSSQFQNMITKAATTNNLFSMEFPYDGVKEGWSILRQSGAKIHIVTARPHTAWEQTARWLHYHNLIPDHLHFTHDKSIMSYVSAGHAAAIDDHVEYYDSLEKSGVFAVLCNQPWNQEHPNAVRVDSFLQFAKLITKINKRELPCPTHNVKSYYKKQWHSLMETVT